jgi:hypothetical protein
MTSAPLFKWRQNRAAGLLLHPTSLPGSTGIGTFGSEAIHFVDFLADAGMIVPYKMKGTRLSPMDRDGLSVEFGHCESDLGRSR